MDTQTEEKNQIWKFIIWSILRLAEDSGYDLNETSFLYSPEMITKYDKDLDKNIPEAYTIIFNKNMWNGEEQEVNINGQSKSIREGGIREQFDFQDHICHRLEKPKFKENIEIFKLMKVLTKKFKK